MLQRRNNASLPWPSGGAVKEWASVEAFGLTGISPIGVTVGGTTQNWNVSAGMSTARPAVVEHDLTRTGDTTGTFTGTISIPLIVRFQRSNQVKTLDLGVVSLSTSSGTWTTIATSNTAAIAVPQLSLGVALTATFNSSALTLNVIPAAINSGRPGATYVDPTAIISPTVGTIGRYCSIGAGATIDSGAVIGQHATIGTNVHVSSNAIGGDYSSVDSDASIGSDTQVGSSCTIGTNCTIGNGATLCRQVVVSNGASVGSDAVIRSHAVLSSSCSIGSGADIGNGATVGASTTVNAGLQVFMGASVSASSTLTEDIVLARYTDGTQSFLRWPSGLSPTSLLNYTISTMNTPGEDDAADTAQGNDNIKSATEPDGLHPTRDPKYDGLGDSIGDVIAMPPGFGGPYDRKLHNCNSYADACDLLLNSYGFTTTFTVVSKKDPDGGWECNPKKPRYLWTHALADVHWSDEDKNMVTWIDAMWLPPYCIDPLTVHDEDTDFDNNGDGVIEYSDGKHVDDPTDGDLRIEVYDSRPDAEAAWGHPFQG